MRFVIAVLNDDTATAVKSDEFKASRVFDVKESELNGLSVKDLLVRFFQMNVSSIKSQLLDS